MRIAAKRLRYTLELARPVYLGNLPGGNLTETLEAVKKLQTLLGEIHDCDVWVETFAEFAREESGEMQLQFGSGQRFARLQSGLDYLCQERTDRRHQVFGELVTYWQELKDQGVWDRLATLLERGGVQMKSAESQ
jgi:CHAD domain-containing protein